MDQKVELTAAEAFKRLVKAGGKLPADEMNRCVKTILESSDLRYTIWTRERYGSSLTREQRDAIELKLARGTSLGMPRVTPWTEDGKDVGEAVISVSDESGLRSHSIGSSPIKQGPGPITIRSHIAKGKGGDAYLTVAAVHRR